MSFILDALKKSQEEREQRQSPPGTLAASFQPVYPEDDAIASRPVWLWLIVALLATVAVLLLLLLLTLKDSPNQVVVSEPLPLSPGSKSATASNTVAPVTVAPAPDQAEVVLKASPPPVVVAAPVVGPDVGPVAASASGAKSVPEPVKSQPATSTQSVTEPAQATSANVDKPDDSLQTVQESPAVDVQQTPPYQVLKTIPDLEITGHLYSTLADKRYVNMNGRVWHEGDYLSEQIRISSITPDGLILDAGGWKIAVGRSQGWQALR